MKRIKVEPKKCSGCKICEIACSLRHGGEIHPSVSRIRVYVAQGLCIPVLSCEPVTRACKMKNVLVLGEDEIDWCVVCPSPCYEKSSFRDPKDENFLVCEGCMECTVWCPSGAIIPAQEEGHYGEN